MNSVIEFDFRGFHLIMDSIGFELFQSHSGLWGYATTKGRTYLKRTINKKTRYFHRMIIGEPIEMQVDHVNGNSLDNRIHNLRICTSQQNSFNRGINKNNQSGATGVSWNNSTQRWHSYIYWNGNRIHLGFYANKEMAIEVRKIAEKKYFGDFLRK